MGFRRSSALSTLEVLNACKTFYLPPILCGLPLRCHPHHEAMSAQADNWAFRFIKVAGEDHKKHLRQCRTPLYASFTVPYGDFAQALATAKYLWLITILDDVMEEEGEESLDFFLDLARGTKSITQVPQKPVLIAQAELVSDLRQLMSPVVFQRLLLSYDKFVKSYDGGNGQQEHEFTLESYAIHRREDFIMKPLLNFTQMCLGVELTDEDLQQDEYLRAVDAMLDHLWLVNDIFSFPKELRNKALDKNYIPLLLGSASATHTVQDAVDKMVEMMQEKEKEFVYYISSLSQKATERRKHEFVAYLNAIAAVIPGNLRWHYLTARYHGVDNPVVTGEPFSGTWLLQENKTNII